MPARTAASPRKSAAAISEVAGHRLSEGPRGSTLGVGTLMTVMPAGTSWLTQSGRPLLATTTASVARTAGSRVAVGGKITAESFRKTLQRARGKFLELLIEELRVTIHPASPEDIEAEIFDLGLGNLYRRYSNELD